MYTQSDTVADALILKLLSLGEKFKLSDEELLKSKMGKDTLIHLAASTGCSNTLKLLLEKAREMNDVDIDAPGEHGLSPLLYAAKGLHLKCVQLLLAQGADREKTDDHAKDVKGLMESTINAHWKNVTEEVNKLSSSKKGQEIKKKLTATARTEQTDLKSLRDQILRLLKSGKGTPKNSKALKAADTQEEDRVEDLNYFKLGVWCPLREGVSRPITLSFLCSFCSSIMIRAVTAIENDAVEKARDILRRREIVQERTEQLQGEKKLKTGN